MIKRFSIKITSDNTRVVPLLFNPGNKERVQGILNYIKKLDFEKVKYQNNTISNDFSNRHYNYSKVLNTHYNNIIANYKLEHLQNDGKKMYAGACFTKEYSIESAALFNPSMVEHPDQSGLQAGEKRFIMSLRATGEGHISSIAFRTGILTAGGDILLSENQKPLINSHYYSKEASDSKSSYTISFPADSYAEQRVIFPYSDAECAGMEDLRLVHFHDGDENFYAGTYTAYNGKTFTTHLLYTHDFCHFRIDPLTGSAVQDKGMALFPKKINGKYAMISRQGGRDISIMFSDDLFKWNESTVIAGPSAPWNIIQTGNCGSPVYTEKGWILMTHGVGAFRKYTIGALLLDKQNPEKVIGMTDSPLLSPDKEEREGYVPNVLYSCGGFGVKEQIIFPYAMSDTATGICTININKLLDSF